MMISNVLEGRFRGGGDKGATHSSAGAGVPQLLATKRFVGDALLAASIKFSSALDAASSPMEMVDITVWTLFVSSVFMSCETSL